MRRLCMMFTVCVDIYMYYDTHIRSLISGLGLIDLNYYKCYVNTCYLKSERSQFEHIKLSFINSSPLPTQKKKQKQKIKQS